jgi:hypothetical protein
MDSGDNVALNVIKGFGIFWLVVIAFVVLNAVASNVEDGKSREIEPTKPPAVHCELEEGYMGQQVIVCDGE